MKNTVIKTIIVAISLFALNSCTKNEIEKPVQNNALEFIGKYFDDNKFGDFVVLTSTTHGVGLFETNDLVRSKTTIMGFSENGINNMGSLKVNDFSIPFAEGVYCLNTDTTINTLSFTGMNNQYEFVGNGEIPSFTTNYYSPVVTNLSYGGLVDNKLPKNSGLQINWTPDSDLFDGRAVVVLFAENIDNGDTELIYKEVNDSDGSANFNNSEIAVISSKYKSFNVFYAKGNSFYQVIQGKNIEFSFINYSWSRIFFAN